MWAESTVVTQFSVVQPITVKLIVINVNNDVIAKMEWTYEPEDKLVKNSRQPVHCLQTYSIICLVLDI